MHGEKAAVNSSKFIMEQLDQARIQEASAERAGDLDRVAEYRYQKIPELERQLESARSVEDQILNYLEIE